MAMCTVIRQLCYEFLFRQLGNAGGVDPLLPQHLSAPVLTAINEHHMLQDRWHWMPDAYTMISRSKHKDT
jgi:hypothetical protein